MAYPGSPERSTVCKNDGVSWHSAGRSQKRRRGAATYELHWSTKPSAVCFVTRTAVHLDVEN